MALTHESTLDAIEPAAGNFGCPYRTGRLPIDARCGRRRSRDARWGAVAALLSTLLCSCQSSGGPANQASTRQSAVSAKDPSQQVKEISVRQLKNWMSTGQAFMLIDVREDYEWQAGHATAAIHISRWTLADRIMAAVPDKATCIVLYCWGGVRSATAAATLQKMGYTNVLSLAGGLAQYELAGLPIQR
jgi:rhodanese-related sulfurtransferase